MPSRRPSRVRRRVPRCRTFAVADLPDNKSRRIRRRSQWWGTGLWVCWQCWPPSSSAPSLRLARWLDDTDN